MSHYDAIHKKTYFFDGAVSVSDDVEFMPMLMALTALAGMITGTLSWWYLLAFTLVANARGSHAQVAITMLVMAILVEYTSVHTFMMLLVLRAFFANYEKTLDIVIGVCFLLPVFSDPSAFWPFAAISAYLFFHRHTLSWRTVFLSKTPPHTATEEMMRQWNKDYTGLPPHHEA